MANEGSAPQASGAVSSFVNKIGVDQEAYSVVIHSRGKTGANPLTVRGWIPEDVTLSTRAEYAPPMGDILNNLPSWASALAGMAGMSPQFQAMSVQTWTGSSPLELTIPILLVAESNAYNEVVLPMLSLQKLCLPSKGPSGNLIPPGPVLFEGMSPMEGDEIEVRIGSFVTFKKVVMLDVQANPKNIPAIGSKAPMRATINVTFRTHTVVTREELDEMYGQGGGSDGGDQTASQNEPAAEAAQAQA